MGIFIGICLIFFCLYQLALNEGRSIGQIRAIEDVKKNAIEVVSADVRSENDEKLVILSGTISSFEGQSDEFYNIVGNTYYVLDRIVEMYQYEKKTSGSSTDNEQVITYPANWYTVAINSSSYPEDHQNPPWPSSEGFKPKTKWANKASIGAFSVNQAQLMKLGATNHISIPSEAELPSGYHISGNYITNAENTPSVGDMRISFATNTTKDATLIGKQSGSEIVDYTTKNKKSINDMRPNRLTKEEYVAQLTSENSAMTWFLRIMFTVFVCLGFSMIFKPIEVLTRVIPFVGRYIAGFAKGVATFIGIVFGVVLSLVVIIISWIFVRPLVALGLVVVVVGLIFMVVKMKRRVV